MKLKNPFHANYEGMEKCCVLSLDEEMYRRDEAGELLEKEGDTLNCGICNAEMICNSDGPSGKLRWRWKGNK